MNWLLINPPQYAFLMFPLGIAYISSALKAASIKVHTLDLAFASDCDCDSGIKSAISDAMQKAPIDVIGIGGLYADHQNITKIIALCRETNPSALIVVGNGVVSCDPVLMLPALGADIAVIGEGEETVVALHHAIKNGAYLENVKGIAFFDKNKSVVVTAPRTTHTDIDLIAMPDYDGFHVENYVNAHQGSSTSVISWMDNYRGLPILASRSCPLSCTFCYHTISTYRKRSMENFFAEVKFLVERYDVNSLQIYDDLFAVKRERVQEFCEGIKKYKLLWMAQLRVGNIAPGKIDLPVLQQMRQAGCRLIQLGLESVNSKVLASMKKKITLEQIETATELVTRANIHMRGNFIFGDRVETAATANETLDWWRRHPHYRIDTDIIWVFPGTELYIRGKADGRIPNDDIFLSMKYPIVNLSEMDDDTFTNLRDTLHIFTNYLTRTPAQVQKTEKGALIGKIMCANSTVICPHCGEAVPYKDHGYWQRFICRLCGGMFDIPIVRLLGRTAMTEDSSVDLEQAELALRTGDHATALALAKTRFDENAVDWAAASIMGAAMLKCGFVEAAHYFLRKSLDINPDNGSACNNLGICLYAMNSVAVALLMFRQAIHLETSIPEAVVNEKIALLHLGGDDHILDFVHSPDRPWLPIDSLLVSIPVIERIGSNTAVHPPFRSANDHLRRLVQGLIQKSELACGA